MDKVVAVAFMEMKIPQELRILAMYRIAIVMGQ
jgi:hypothetical protein